MKRNYAFWGTLCFVSGVLLLLRDQLTPAILNWNSTILTVGAVGIVALGISLVAASSKVQTLAAIAAGACIALAISMSILSFGRYLRIGSVPIYPQLSLETLDRGECNSCGDHEPDRERKRWKDDRVQVSDTAVHNPPSVDSTKRTSIY